MDGLLNFPNSRKRQKIGFTEYKLAISHKNYLHQVNSWKNFWKFWDDPLCRNKSGSYPPHRGLRQETASDTAANSIDNMERGIGLRICVKYYGLYFLLIPNSLESWGIGIFEVPLISYILLDYEDSLSGTLCL